MGVSLGLERCKLSNDRSWGLCVGVERVIGNEGNVGVCHTVHIKHAGSSYCGQSEMIGLTVQFDPFTLVMHSVQTATVCVCVCVCACAYACL